MYKLAGVIWNDDGTMATKELLPLEALKSLRCAVSLGLGSQYEEMNNKCDIIESALKDQQKTIEVLSAEKTILSNNYNELKARHRKQLKALEIIKEKRVDVDWLICATDTVKDYNDKIKYQKHFLNQEEYDLLKEVLK